jgi:RNA polymerase sigma factor (TIGR02999 family)
MVATHGQITALLHHWQEGQPEALSRLIPEVFDELRRLARHYLARETPSHTLQPTALVHEVYLRLVGHTVGKLDSRSQFFAFAARLMREILVDHARARKTAKRGGDASPASLAEVGEVVVEPAVDVTTVLAIDAALQRLGKIDPRQRQIVELRYFVGLTLKEIAGVLEISQATVERSWSAARHYLAREMGGRGRTLRPRSVERGVVARGAVARGIVERGIVARGPG